MRTTETEMLQKWKQWKQSMRLLSAIYSLVINQTGHDDILLQMPQVLPLAKRMYPCFPHYVPQEFFIM